MTCNSETLTLRISPRTKISQRVLRICATILLFGVLVFIAGWIRVQNRNTIPEGQFTETDAYFYYWQAGIIAEQGQLPARDMHRWVPLGRDNQQTLHLYSYVLVYAHKIIAAIFPNVTLYQVCLYMPVICFCLGLSALCLFLYYADGQLFAFSVGMLLATLPGTIDRSAVGFGDRDAWCLMLGILAIITYLTSLQTQSPHKRLLWTLISGFIVFIGGLSWEGFGVFLSVILVVEVWRFLTSETEEGLIFYTLWVCVFVPTLYFGFPAYRSGYGFAKHIFAFLIAPPLVFLAVRWFRSLLLSKVEKLRPYARTLSLGLTLASVIIALGYVVMQLDSFAHTTVSLNKNMLMQTVRELRPPRLGYWYTRYGSVFLLGCLGAFITTVSLWKKHEHLFSLSVVLFSLTTFFSYPLERLFGASAMTLLFGLSLLGCSVAFACIANTWRQNRKTADEYIRIAILALFIIWAALARDARRYHFFLGLPLAYLTTECICAAANALTLRIQKYAAPKNGLKSILTLGLLGLILFCPLTGGHARNAHTIAGTLKKALPGEKPIAKAYTWMKTTLPDTAVVAARWYYGSQLNVLGGVKTIIDQDHYIPYWIHLHRRYISIGFHEWELLTFLKSHKATHLMIPQKLASAAIERAQASGTLVPVYPTKNFEMSPIKIWEIHYPLDIKMDMKYLETGIPEIDAQLQTP